MEIQATDIPPYLYKVISLRLWQTTQTRNVLILPKEDDLFVHFAREDQLDKILHKYWSEVPQVVILKVNTAQVEGKWVYEQNPGGMTKYFHLYGGRIPFYSILESKIIYRQPLNPCGTHSLEIVRIGDPLLRQRARDLSREEILSSEIQDLIEAMKVTMRAAPGIGLAAPQIGKSLQLLVIEDIDHSHLTPQQLVEKDRHPVSFHVIINPSIYVEKGTPQVEFFEGCLSIPSLLGVVPRAKSIQVECLNERAEPITLNAQGWYARILQHEIDHLNGILYLDRALLPTLMTEENYTRLWKGKTIKEVIDHLVLAN